MMNNILSRPFEKTEVSKISMVFVICIINNLLHTWKNKEHLNSIMFLSLANIEFICQETFSTLAVLYLLRYS